MIAQNFPQKIEEELVEVRSIKGGNRFNGARVMNNEEQDYEQSGLSRRGFLHGMGGAGALLGMTGIAAADDAPRDADGKIIPGFEKTKDDPNAAKGWQPVSDRRVRVGIA